MTDWMEKARRRLRIADMIGGSAPMNSFDQFLADTREELAVRWRRPVIELADILYVCKKWFEGHEVAFTASDLLAISRLVLERMTREEETAP